MKKKKKEIQRKKEGKKGEKTITRKNEKKKSQRKSKIKNIINKFLKIQK